MEGKKPFFKIVIPNYNNYIYIKKCLDSVLEQTFKDYVCIVVDDLSTDDSPKIAQIYARRYPDRFKFVQLKEKGHEGGARNAGIDYPIDCEYYYFVDSDDYLHDKHVLQKCRDSLTEDSPDVMFVRMIQINEHGKQIVPQPKFSWNDINMFISGFNSACTKFVKAEKIQKFLENCDHAADVYQTIKLMDSIKTVKQTNIIAYVYRRNPTSLTYNGKYKEDVHLFYDNIKKLCSNLTNTNVLNAVLFRIRQFSEGKIMF